MSDRQMGRQQPSIECTVPLLNWPQMFAKKTKWYPTISLPLL
jgi:hypothetical protein